MANSKITDLTNYTTPVSSDVLPIVDVSGGATKKVAVVNLFNILSSLFTVKDSSDTSKKFAINASGISTATTRTMTVPDADFTPVGTTLTQTIQNKTIGAGTQINTSGSDPTGSMYYRDASGNMVPLAPGAAGTILDISAGGLPEFIPNPAAANASTTVKGVVEEATQSEVDSGTQTGGTGAELFVNPTTIRARLLNTGIADTGSANTYAIAPSPAITAYAAYQEFTFKAANANTGASTLAVNGLTTKSITRVDGSALRSGDILAGQLCTVVYDGTAFQLVSQSGTNAVYNPVQKIYSDATSGVAASTNTPVTAYTQTINGGTFAAGNIMHIHATFKLSGTASNTVSFDVKYGGTTLGSFSTSTSGNTDTYVLDLYVSIITATTANIAQNLLRFLSGSSSTSPTGNISYGATIPTVASNQTFLIEVVGLGGIATATYYDSYMEKI